MNHKKSILVELVSSILVNKVSTWAGLYILARLNALNFKKLKFSGRHKKSLTISLSSNSN